MDWFPFHISDLSTPKLSAATSSAFGAWVRILANCYRLGNGGYYEYCSEYNSRQWMSIAGVDKAEVDEVVKAGLAMWEGTGLRIDGYDKEQESKAKNRSDKARLAIKARWSNTRSISRSNTEERRGEEKKGEENKEDPPSPPAGGKRAQVSYPEEFEAVWKAYGRKEDKAGALPAWKSIAKSAGGDIALRDAILAALEWQAPIFAADAWKFAPHFVRYLKRNRWLDEKPAQQTKLFRPTAEKPHPLSGKTAEEVYGKLG